MTNTITYLLNMLLCSPLNELCWDVQVPNQSPPYHTARCGCETFMLKAPYLVLNMARVDPIVDQAVKHISKLLDNMIKIYSQTWSTFRPISANTLNTSVHTEFICYLCTCVYHLQSLQLTL